MKRRVIACSGAVGVIVVLFLGLAYFGVCTLNRPSRAQYPVRGVDVSCYQGQIDWPVLASQGIEFAFIKATEGSGHVDPRFAQNWAAASQTDLRIGAYHFFSYDSPGSTQAQNFIQTVAPVDGMLPPVVDVEFYGDKEQNLPEPAAVQTELTVLLESWEQAYGLKPILYATEKSYRLYLAGHFDDYDIWIRDVVWTPTLEDQRTWTFWQYSNRGRLGGYHGDETYIDLNVFAGTQQAFTDYGR